MKLQNILITFLTHSCVFPLFLVHSKNVPDSTIDIISNSIDHSTPIVLELKESIPEKNETFRQFTEKGSAPGRAERLIQDSVFISPLLETNLPIPAELDDQILGTIQKAVTDIYFAIKNDVSRRKAEELRVLEESFRSRLQDLDIDLNSKIMTIETNTMNKIHTLSEMQIAQRKEDIQMFSENLNEIQKAHQNYVETQRADIQEMKSTVETATKGQTSLSNKMAQFQKSIHNMDSKLSDMTRKHPEDIGSVQESQKNLEMFIEELEKDVKATTNEIAQIQSIVFKLEKASIEDHNKLRKAMIRDQKKDPIQNCIRYLRNKNLAAAVKQWRVIEQITDDLKDALAEDMTKIIEDAYDHRNPSNLMHIFEFIHKAVSSGERRLKESAYGYLLQEMGAARHLTDSKKLAEVFQLAQYMKADLGATYNTSSSTAEIVSRLPEAIRLITFEKVRLSLPSRGYLKVGTDRKVALVPEDVRFYDNDEVLWTFEYDKDKADGTFFIKSDKLHKYLLTIQEGYNSYGFKKQILFMTGNKRENGTRFEVSNVSGDNILLRSSYWNGYLTWKSNIQTIYGDDDSYFVLLEDKKNGPSPYWIVQSENDFKK